MAQLFALGVGKRRVERSTWLVDMVAPPGCRARGRSRLPLSLEPDRLAAQVLIQSIEIAEMLLRVVVPMILVGAFGDRLQVRLKLRQPNGRLHQVVNQEPSLGIGEKRVIQGRAESGRVVGQEIGRADPFLAALNVRQVIESRPIDLSRNGGPMKRAGLTVDAIPSTTARGASPLRLSSPVLNVNWCVPSWARVVTFL